MAANKRMSFEQEPQVRGESGQRGMEVFHQTEHMVQEHPTASALLTFGLGFGVGLMLTALLTPEPRPHHWYEDYRPEWMSRKRMGKTVSSLMPEAVARRMR